MRQTFFILNPFASKQKNGHNLSIFIFYLLKDRRNFFTLFIFYFLPDIYKSVNDQASSKGALKQVKMQ